MRICSTCRSISTSLHLCVTWINARQVLTADASDAKFVFFDLPSCGGGLHPRPGPEMTKWWFPKSWWYPQLSSILVGFSIINHPAIGVPPF